MCRVNPGTGHSAEDSLHLSDRAGISDLLFSARSDDTLMNWRYDVSGYESEETLARKARFQADHPPDYNERRSVLEFLRPLVEWVGRFLLFVIATSVVVLYIPEVLIPVLVVGLVVALYCAWRIKGAHWAWTHRRILVDGSTGVMTIKQGGPWWWGLSESSDDKAELGESTFRTIDRKFLQRKELFNCDTAIVRMPDGELVISNLLYAARIDEIHSYVNSLSRQNVVHQIRQTELLEEIARSMRRPSTAASVPSSGPTPVVAPMSASQPTDTPMSEPMGLIEQDDEPEFDFESFYRDHRDQQLDPDD